MSPFLYKYKMKVFNEMIKHDIGLSMQFFCTWI